MGNIKLYESFINSGSDEKEKVEILSEILEESKADIKKFMEDRGLDSDFVEVTEPDQFVMEYWPQEYSGRIPKKISYYLDDLAKMISENLGAKVDWAFSPNGNAQRIEFNLESDIDPKVLSVIKRLKNA